MLAAFEAVGKAEAGKAVGKVEVGKAVGKAPVVAVVAAAEAAASSAEATVIGSATARLAEKASRLFSALAANANTPRWRMHLPWLRSRPTRHCSPQSNAMWRST